MTTKTLAIATAVFSALFGASASANAHGHKGHFFFGGPQLRIVVAPSYDCGYYYEKWMDTGSLNWKRKYYVCKGWW